jgi:hypothetical protein
MHKSDDVVKTIAKGIDFDSKKGVFWTWKVVKGSFGRIHRI